LIAVLLCGQQHINPAFRGYQCDNIGEFSIFVLSRFDLEP